MPPKYLDFFNVIFDILVLLDEYFVPYNVIFVALYLLFSPQKSLSGT